MSDLKRKLDDQSAKCIVDAAFAKYREDDPQIAAFMAGAWFGFKLATEPREDRKS